MAVVDPLLTYRDLFLHRTDDYALQRANGRYYRAGAPLPATAIRDHLAGVRTYGTYVISEAGTCKVAVFDIDTSPEVEQGLAVLEQIRTDLAHQGAASYLERSRRGGHLWLFLRHPVPASQVRAWLTPLLPPAVELYPKQDEGKRYGSLIRLPLGIHRLSGKRYPFVERTATGYVPVAHTVAGVLDWLAHVETVDVPGRSRDQDRGHDPKHTSFSFPAMVRATAAPRSIREWSAQQDPVRLIGRYVHLDSAGVGCCPFGWHHRNGKDQHPSFKVYVPGTPGGYCWYCYTWQQGGSVFDFLRYYYGLDARTLWQRLQHGHNL